MGAGLNKVLIIALVLVSFGFLASIAAAQEGMWHSASEVGPGTFIPGVYTFPSDANLTIRGKLYINTVNTYQNPNWMWYDDPAERYLTFYHNMTYPSKNSGISIVTNGTGISASATTGAAASFSSYYGAAAIFITHGGYDSATKFYNLENGPVAYFSGDSARYPMIEVSNYNSSATATSIKANGRVDVTGTLNVTAGRICLNGVCKDAWPGGGGGGLTENDVIALIIQYGSPGSPPLRIVTRSYDPAYATRPPYNDSIEDGGNITDVEIKTGGLKLWNNGVIRSESGNVVIKLGIS